MFVVYLTIYQGDKLPPFYIGSTSAVRIKNGYYGSVRSEKWRAIWEEELRNSPQKFDILVLSEHSTRESALVEEQRLHVSNNVAKNSSFVNMAIARGTFVNRGYWTEEEKQRMRKPHVMTEKGRRAQLERAAGTRGRKNTPETLERMRLAALSRKKAPPVSEATRAKLRASTTAVHARRKAKQNAQNMSKGA